MGTGFIGILGLLLTSWASVGQAAPIRGAPFQKVMIVFFENEDRDDVLKFPSFAKFATQGAFLPHFMAETHPSQPNYIAMVAGDTMGVTGDGVVSLNAYHVGDLLEAKGKTWKAYLEGYPGGCNPTARIGAYARKHNPFMSFINVSKNTTRCAQHLVPAGQLAEDIRNNQVPDFSLYIPDMNNDGHDTSLTYADQYFARTFAPLMKDPRFTKDMLFVVTFDEGTRTGNNNIYTAMTGPGVLSGSQSDYTYDHYSLLRTIEIALDLGHLGRNDARASPIQGIWKN